LKSNSSPGWSARNVATGEGHLKFTPSTSPLGSSIAFRIRTVLPVCKGDPTDGVYILRAGRVVVRLPSDANVCRFETLDPGTLIGLAAALNGSYSVSAVAVQQSNFGYISVAFVKHILSSYPDFCRAATDWMARKVLRIRALALSNAATIH
jgi:CRP-like cAMP-binding protein